MKNYYYKLLITLLVGSLLIPILAQANVTISNPLKAQSLVELIELIIKFVFNLALWIAPIMFIVAGFYYITAAGDPEKIKTAKKIILYTAIGLIIVISARGLVKLFEEIFRK